MRHDDDDEKMMKMMKMMKMLIFGISLNLREILVFSRAGRGLLHFWGFFKIFCHFLGDI